MKSAQSAPVAKKSNRKEVKKKKVPASKHFSFLPPMVLSLNRRLLRKATTVMRKHEGQDVRVTLVPLAGVAGDESFNTRSWDGGSPIRRIVRQADL